MIERTRKRLAHAAAAADARICGAFVVAVVIGSAWFYEHVLCFAIRIVH